MAGILSDGELTEDTLKVTMNFHPDHSEFQKNDGDSCLRSWCYHWGQCRVLITEEEPPPNQQRPKTLSEE